MGGIFITIRNWWERADRNQRAISLGGVGLLVLLLLGTFLFASRPHYALLYTDMNEADKGEVVKEIQSMNISAKYDVAGEIEVPADKLEEVNMHLAASGKMPKNVHYGLDDLKNVSMMGSTPGYENARLLAILEGELAKSIETLEGVQAARVKISPADNSPFTSTHKPASAGVTITESGTGHLTSAQGQAIATLLQDSVPGLDTDHITVINQRMEFLFNGSDKNSQSSQANTKIQAEQDFDHTFERELQGKLEEVYGPGSTVVSVHAQLDLDTESKKSTITNPTDTLTSTKQTEIMSGAQNKAAGVSGQASNTAQPVAKDGAGGPGQQYKNTNETVAKGTSTIETATDKAPGSVKAMVINVIADAAKITDVRQTALRSIVDGEVKEYGSDPTLFPTNVTFVTFDTTSVTEATKATSAAASQSRIQQLIAVLPIGALLLIALMVMKQISRFARAQTAMMSLPDGGTMALDMSGMHGGMVSEAGAANILAALEGVTVQGLAHGQKLALPEDEDPDITDIKNRIHVPLEQLKRMAGERPQMVAMLIKSLLLEDRK